MKQIADRYFNELKDNGHTVPRDTKTGEVLPFTVSKEYVIKNKDTGETIKARCTQNCPCSLKRID